MLKKLVILVSFLFTAGVAVSQTTGKISGTITDKATGEGLPGANVIVENTTLGASTDADGFYVIFNVPVGKHTVSVTYIGYKKVVNQNVVVNVDNTTQLNVKLEESTEEEDVVIVEIDKFLIRKDETNTRTIKTSDEIKNLPVTSAQEIISLGAGIVRSDNSNTIYTRGGRAEQTGIIVDGVLINNPLSGVANSDVNTNAIEEVTVQTGGFDAEFGRVMSGIAQITTKSGTERYKFNGEFITDKLGDQIFSINSQEFLRYSFSVGGPIIPENKDYTFFLSFDHKDQADGAPRYNVKGPRPTAGDITNNLNGSVKANIGAEIVLKATGGFSIIDSDVYDHSRNYFGVPEHFQVIESKTYNGSLQMTYTLDQSTYFTLRYAGFLEKRESGDSKHWKNFKNYGLKSLNENTGTHPGEIVRDGLGPLAVTSYPSIVTPTNSVFNTYSKSFVNTHEYSLDFNSFISGHTLKFGLNYKLAELRQYAFNPRSAWQDVGGGDYYFADDSHVTKAQRWKLYHDRSNGFGYNIYGTWSDKDNYFEGDAADGSDPAKKPIEFAFYLKDVVEFDDFVLNFGMRLDYYNPNDFMFKDFSKPLGDLLVGQTQATFDKSDFVESEAFSIWQPRIGFSFPVDENTKFSGQFGLFAQMPTYNQLFTSYREYKTDLLDPSQASEQFITNPNLKPSKTLSYELAVHHQLNKDIVLVATAYYKEIRDLIQNQYVTLARTGASGDPNAGVFNYILPLNVDYSTAKGIDFSINTKRFSRLLLNFNYSLAYATGTGSTSGTVNQILILNGANGQFPKFETPLNFDQRHTGSLNLDYRFGDDDGPSIFDTKALSNFGVNVVYRFNSGRPYTGREIEDPYAGRGIEQASPTSTINGLRMPWSSFLDLRIDKSFNLNMGENQLGLNVYTQILNLLDTENWVSVHRGTGKPNDSGYLTSVKNNNYTSANEISAFKWRDNNPTNYASPRQIRFGLRLDF